MADRNFLFAHELADSLKVSAQTVARLIQYGYLRDARMAFGNAGCTFIYDAAKIDALGVALSETGQLSGTPDFLNAIEREE